MFCYHSQQAVEKILKAILVKHEVEVPFTHNLLDLNNAVKEFNYEAPVSDEECVFLNSVYRSRKGLKKVKIFNNDDKENVGDEIKLKSYSFYLLFFNNPFR